MSKIQEPSKENIQQKDLFPFFFSVRSFLPFWIRTQPTKFNEDQLWIRIQKDLFPFFFSVRSFLPFWIRTQPTKFNEDQLWIRIRNVLVYNSIN